MSDDGVNPISGEVRPETQLVSSFRENGPCPTCNNIIVNIVTWEWVCLECYCIPFLLTCYRIGYGFFSKLISRGFIRFSLWRRFHRFTMTYRKTRPRCQLVTNPYLESSLAFTKVIFDGDLKIETRPSYPMTPVRFLVGLRRPTERRCAARRRVVERKGRPGSGPTRPGRSFSNNLRSSFRDGRNLLPAAKR